MSEKKTYKLDLDEYYVRPQAAWEKMKAAQNIRQTVYIYGTTGTGKTSFVADFLARKRYCYIDMAAIGMEKGRLADPDFQSSSTEMVKICLCPAYFRDNQRRRVMSDRKRAGNLSGEVGTVPYGSCVQ